MVQNLEFEQLVEEAEKAAFAGWDFSWLEGRRVTEVEENLLDLYDRRAHLLLGTAQAFFDHGTGGGEHLSRLGPFPKISIATEAYPPNVALAAQNLTPLGVQVIQIDDTCHDTRGPQPDGSFSERKLPFEDESFDLVLAYNSAFCPAEIFRVLRPGGTLLTCQVGTYISPTLAEVLGGPVPIWDQPGHAWDIEAALAAAGFSRVKNLETVQKVTYKDIGAIVYFLKAVPWIITDFEVAAYKEPLLKLHQHIKSNGGFISRNKQLFFEVQKP
jgi:SAM-dependent methyltransferase